jgi:hypothetical protein
MIPFLSQFLMVSAETRSSSAAFETDVKPTEVLGSGFKLFLYSTKIAGVFYESRFDFRFIVVLLDCRKR